MATSPDLVKAVSAATGLSLATVTDLDRRLATRELRSKGGRGPNAAKMTLLDAARLLTAVLASPQSSAAADAVLRYEDTRPDKARSSDGLFGKIGLDDLAALPARHGFVDALKALISSASTGSLAKMIAGADGNSIPRIEIYAFTQATRGRIRLTGLPNGLTASIEYVPASSSLKLGRSRKIGRRRAAAGGDSAGDLEQSRRITERTIFAVAQLLAEGCDHAL